MFKFFIISTALFISFTGHGITPEEWHQLSLEKKVEFHRLLITSLSESDSRTSFDPKLYSSFKKNFRGIASRESCIYGGWVSTMNSGVCRHPYKGNKKYQACGLRGVHRCNPLIFGESDKKSFSGSQEGKGICVKARRDNSSSITWACIKAAYGSDDSIDLELFRKHLKTLKGDSRYLGEYLAEATEIIEKHCPKKSDNFCGENIVLNNCQKLRNSFFAKTNASPALIGCRNRHEILLGEVKNSFSDGRKALEIYFPLLEESREWKSIREMGEVSKYLSDETLFWPHLCNPQQILRGNLLNFKELKYHSCFMKKKLLEKKMIEQTPWGSMSLGERAERIHTLADESYVDIKTSTKDFISKSGVFNDREKIDGNVFHRDANPAMAACFIYQESKGRLNPFVYTNSACKNIRLYTSYGLGQITLSTLQDISEMNDGSNLPLVTAESQHFYWHQEHSKEPMNGKDIHRYMGFSPRFQTELVLRIINRKAKVANTRYKDKYGIKNLVGRYYGCNIKKQYCRNVMKKYIDNIRSCMGCFREGRPASDCYYALEKCESQDCKKAVRKGEFSLR